MVLVVILNDICLQIEDNPKINSRNPSGSRKLKLYHLEIPIGTQIGCPTYDIAKSPNFVLFNVLGYKTEEKNGEILCNLSKFGG